MSRSGVLLVLLAVLALAQPPAAAAQTPVVNPVCLIGACDEDDEKTPEEDDRSECPLPATLVCAGDAILGGAVDAAQAGIGAAGDAVMGGLTSWVAGGASWLLTRAARMLDRSTRPALGSTWFQRQYSAMVAFAIALSLFFFLCAIVHALLRQDVRAMARTVLLALPCSLLLCFAAVTLVEGTLAVTDWMSSLVLRRFERDTGEFFADVSEVLVPASLSGSPIPGFLLFLGALFTALATFVVWLELVVREAAIYVAVAFLPLCFSAMVWERTAHWCRRLIELLAALILAKFAIAVAIALAAGAMAHGRPAQGGLTALMAGCAVMLIAALTPWMLLRLVPIAEAAGHLALHRGSARAAAGSLPGAQTAAMVVRQSVLAGVSRGVGMAPQLAATVAPPPPVPRSEPATSTAATERRP